LPAIRQAAKKVFPSGLDALPQDTVITGDLRIFFPEVYFPGFEETLEEGGVHAGPIKKILIFTKAPQGLSEAWRSKRWFTRFD
jgi:hypothetical protein